MAIFGRGFLSPKLFGVLLRHSRKPSIWPIPRCAGFAHTLVTNISFTVNCCEDQIDKTKLLTLCQCRMLSPGVATRTLHTEDYRRPCILYAESLAQNNVSVCLVVQLMPPRIFVRIRAPPKYRIYRSRAVELLLAPQICINEKSRIGLFWM